MQRREAARELERFSKRGNIVKKLSALMACLFIAACGGGGGSSAASWSGAFNSSGYPDVAGTYAIATSASTATCSNGTTIPTSAFSGNLPITQSGNTLTYGTSQSTPVGYIQSAVAPTGNIDKNGYAVLNGSVIATSATLSGLIYDSINITATFSPNGFTGTENQTFNYSAYGYTCTASIPLTATKM